MKKFDVMFLFGILFLSTAILSSGCKKETEDPAPTPSAPTFVVTSQPDGTDYFNIWLKCISDDILLTKVVIKDPFNTSYTYTGNQQLWLKDEIIAFPDSYPKSSGTWRLTIYGNRSADNSSFVSSASLNVAGK
jgi:hypothetical protein